MIIYKLRFDNAGGWTSIKSQLSDDDLAKIVSEVINIQVTETVVNPETGEPIITIVEGYHVDLQVTDDIADFAPYLVAPVKQAHKWMGQNDNDIKQPVPTMRWTKKEIRNWLTNHNIEWLPSMNKTELLALVPQ